MSFHKHGHGHDHHHHHHPPEYVEEEYCSEVVHHHPKYVEEEYCEGERMYAAPPPSAYERYEGGGHGHGHGHNSSSNFKRNERLGELGALATGAFALYEENKAKKDPEHASKHQIEAGTAALGALGSGGYAYYEHRQKNKFEDGRW